MVSHSMFHFWSMFGEMMVPHWSQRLEVFGFSFGITLFLVWVLTTEPGLLDTDAKVIFSDFQYLVQDKCLHEQISIGIVDICWFHKPFSVQRDTYFLNTSAWSNFFKVSTTELLHKVLRLKVQHRHGEVNAKDTLNGWIRGGAGCKFIGHPGGATDIVSLVGRSQVYFC